MRRAEFQFFADGELPTSSRHHARAWNFNDQSIFSYPHANKNWWGYA